jgi:hypothetical protein
MSAQPGYHAGVALEACMARLVSLARLFFLLLGIFTVGRWLMGTSGVPYDRGHHVFSLMILTFAASFFYGAFCRRWLGFRVTQAMLLAALMALTAQIVILLATVLSYALGLDTYFNHPRALNAPGALALAQALPVRLGGLVANTITASIVGALGWALGALLPEKP